VADPAFRARLRLAEGRLLLVLDVQRDGGGARPGLRRFDVRTTAIGFPVNDGARFRAALGEAPDFRCVRLGAWRGAEPIRLPAEESGR